MSIHLIGDFLFFWLHIIIAIFDHIIQSELMLFLDCLSLFTRLSMVWFSAGLGTFDPCPLMLDPFPTPPPHPAPDNTHHPTLSCLPTCHSEGTTSFKTME